MRWEFYYGILFRIKFPLSIKQFRNRCIKGKIIKKRCEMNDVTSKIKRGIAKWFVWSY